MIPTLHLTNWSSRKLHGPGRKWSIMARPRRWEHGDGRLSLLTPSVLDLVRLRDGLLTVEQYRARYDEGTQRMADRGFLRPGRMYAVDGAAVIYVHDGDTLCCACSRDKAAAGECHRVWAAEALVEAGWRVLLDGREVAG